jgi:hypothetical protein
VVAYIVSPLIIPPRSSSGRRCQDDCNKDGVVTQVKYRQHVPPDTTACIFWLKNRRPDLWRDRHEIAHKLPPRTDKSIAELRDELLQDMVEAGLVTLLPAPDEPEPAPPAGVANRKDGTKD